MISIVVLGAVAWFILAFPFGVVVGRAITLADARENAERYIASRLAHPTNTAKESPSCSSKDSPASPRPASPPSSSLR